MHIKRRKASRKRWGDLLGFLRWISTPVTLLGKAIYWGWHLLNTYFWILLEYFLPFVSFYHKVALVKMSPEEAVYFQKKLIELGLGDGIKVVGVMSTTRYEFQFELYVDSIRRVEPVKDLIISFGRMCEEKRKRGISIDIPL